MLELRHLVPLDRVPGAVGTEYGVGSVVEVGFGVVGGGADHVIRVVAGAVAGEGAVEPATAVRVGVDVHRVVAHLGDRAFARQHRVGVETAFRRSAGTRQPVGCIVLHRKRAAHALDVGHRPADHVLRHLQAEPVPRFQHAAVPGAGVHRLMHAFGRLRRIGMAFHAGAQFHQPLADCAVGGLAEVAAFGVLQMRAAGDQRVFV